ncbi:hypothetical protein bpmyx0001_41140 [Bacillus pseudomycoides DSM 12442]|nr:hypothetical protein bpmyx0001_41140 [Bacillus pseudomycoides DSM 12442]
MFINAAEYGKKKIEKFLEGILQTQQKKQEILKKTRSKTRHYMV